MTNDEYCHALVTEQWPEGANPAIAYTPWGLAMDPECSEYMHRTGIAPSNMQVAFTFEPPGAPPPEEALSAPASDQADPASDNPSSMDSAAAAMRALIREDPPSPDTQFTLHTQEVVPANPEDAEIVRIIEQNEHDMWARAQAQCPPGTTPAVIMPESEIERALIQKRCTLEKEYQRRLGLPIPPVLVAPAAPEPTGKAAVPAHAVPKSPTELEMATEFIERVLVRRKGSTVYQYVDGYYTVLDKNDLKTLVLSTLKDLIEISGSARLLQTIPEFITSFEEIRIDKDYSPGPRVCVSNGILNLDTLCLEPFDPQYFITWKLNARWDSSEPCVMFDHFLAQVTAGDPRLISRLWEALGYILFAPSNDGKVFFLLYGPGNTGKSVWGRVLESFFDDADVSALSMTELGTRFSTGALAHKRVNLCMDLSDSVIRPEAVAAIKRISGKDAISIEAKYEDPYKLRLDCKLVFSSNFPLRIEGEDPALLSRLVVLPFRCPIAAENRIPNLDAHLIREKNGILFKAACAYQRLKQREFRFEPLPDTELEETSYLSLQSSEMACLQKFVATGLREEDAGVVSTADLFSHYCQFCQDQKSPAIRDKQAFSRQIRPLLEKTYHAVHSKRRINGTPTNCFLRISLQS